MSEPGDVLVALLRLGERSAELAFQSLARLQWSPDGIHQQQLLGVARDERRHDRALAALGTQAPALTRATRRFFVELRHRDCRVHLARIAALDGCVCRIITAVLQGAPDAVGAPLRTTLQAIRRDEARHVRIARDLARHLGADAALLKEWELQTRADMCAVLNPHADDFEALGVDSAALLRSIDRARC